MLAGDLGALVQVWFSVGLVRVSIGFSIGVTGISVGFSISDSSN